jgi:hypothetical protein
MGKRSCLFVFLFLLALAAPGLSYFQSASDGFDPNANYWVNSIAVQSDGKILMGRAFTTIWGATGNHIARLNLDGSRDPGKIILSVSENRFPPPSPVHYMIPCIRIFYSQRSGHNPFCIIWKHESNVDLSLFLSSHYLSVFAKQWL